MRRIFVLGLIVTCTITTGCVRQRTISCPPDVRVRTPAPVFSPPASSLSVPRVSEDAGVFHTVKKGETLWRISKLYGSDVEELAAYNNLPRSCTIEVGQKIFIPDALRKTISASGQQAFTKIEFGWPCRGQVVSFFSQKKQNVVNWGIDIRTRDGLPIAAAAAGNVVFTSDNLRGYGRTIIIQHNETFQTVYTNIGKHNVKIGDFVEQGQVIASAGSSGRTNDSIMHFELRKNNKPQNPLLYLP